MKGQTILSGIMIGIAIALVGVSILNSIEDRAILEPQTQFDFECREYGQMLDFVPLGDVCDGYPSSVYDNISGRYYAVCIIDVCTKKHFTFGFDRLLEFTEQYPDVNTTKSCLISPDKTLPKNYRIICEVVE